MSGGHIALLIVGSLLALVGLGVAAGGGTLLWAHETQRDPDGYFTTSTERFRPPAFALTSERSTSAQRNAGWGSDIGDLARVRVRATSGDPRPVFVGIARATASTAYLSRRGPRRDHRRRRGSVPRRLPLQRTATGHPARPASGRSGWPRAEGRGPQTLEWDLGPGSGRWW